MVMDRDTRLDTIDRLEWENLESRAYLEERQRQREQDPIAFDDYLRAERAAEAEQEALVQRDGGAGDLLYRIHETPLPRVLQAEPVPSEADEGVSAATLTRALGEVIVHERRREREEREAALVERDRKIEELAGEVRELKGLVGDLFQRLEANNDKMKNLIADLEAGRAERRALELEVVEQRGRVGAILRDLR